MSYSGYDIEDAVILNRGSLDRGFGRALYIRRYQSEIKKHIDRNTNETIMDCVMKPSFTLGKEKKGTIQKRYHALDETGTPRVGESLSNGDIIINKYSPGSLDGNEPLKA